MVTGHWTAPQNLGSVPERPSCAFPGTLGRRRDLAGERRFYDLPGPEETDDAEAAEEPPDARDVGGAVHERTAPRKFEARLRNFVGRW